MDHHNFTNSTSGFCPPRINIYITNLTSSYTDQRIQPTMVSASVIMMFVLVGLFFNLNLFSGISDVSAILDPKVRLFLTSALSLFLPVMSYLFSEAKNAGYSSTTASVDVADADLPLRAGLILAWMLLVELLRKKVDEIHMRGYSGTIQRAGRVVWLGSLVFFNIKSAGRKAVFSILWILCATRLLQRIAFTEIGKRSYAHGKNARVISSYMAQMLERHDDNDVEQAVNVGNELLKGCKYIVMGEEKLVDDPTADGYKLNIAPDDDCIVTVGEVWKLAEKDELFTSFYKTKHLERLCLSFALFKLLRRRFEHLPETNQETRDCRNLILNGLYSNNGESKEAEAVFQVMNDEVNFLSEYYHSVVPVVLASPFFLLANYFLVLIFIIVLCLMTIILCGNGDVIYAFSSISQDNYTIQTGIGKLAICLLIRATKSSSSFFSIVDLSSTVLLFIILFYEEMWEFFVFLLSNWFMVSLLYNYTVKHYWLKRPTFFWGGFFWGGFRIITWLRNKMSHGNLSFKQFSVLNLRWPLKLPLLATFSSLAVKTELVPNSVKESIMEFLVEHEPIEDLTNGKSALRRNNLFDHRLSWACNSDSVAEVILTWHIATIILEVKCPPQSEEEATWSRAATKLSKYCAYLVVFHPELLPDNPDKAERVFEDMKKELKRMIGCREYYLSSQRARVEKIMDETTGRRGNQPEAAGQGDPSKVVQDGVKLGRSLMAEDNKWKVLVDVWTELIIFVAPSREEERVKGHEDVLVQGGEFITVLWALTTHIGVSRPLTNKSTTTDDHLDIV